MHTYIHCVHTVHTVHLVELEFELEVAEVAFELLLLRVKVVGKWRVSGSKNVITRHT